MGEAIGMVEFRTVSSGIAAADAMVKAAPVRMLEAQVVCPGKYVAVIAGSISAVQAAVSAARALAPDRLISDFVLGNPHPYVIPAVYGAGKVGEVRALGVVETYDAATVIVAADEAAKAASVELIEIRIARGMCGKSFLLLTGELAAVETSCEKARLAAGAVGMYLDSAVIARPDEKIIEAIM
ncbi:MAG: BMC domain-containing protein [Clostridiales bacterium]|nr:BMC domain-containing protein [Clostridiales bacterium]